jgi:hypothetical protein
MCRVASSGVPRCDCDKPERRSVTRRARAAVVAAEAANVAANTKAVVIETVITPLAGWNVEDIRRVAALIAVSSEFPSFAPGTPRDVTFAAADVYNDARQELVRDFGDVHRAALRVGELVAERAEQIAGVSTVRVQADWQARYDAAEAERGSHKTIMDLDSEDRRDAGQRGNSDGIRERYYEAEKTALELLSGRDSETMGAMRRLADSYQAAIAEIRPLGGTHTFDKRSAKKAVTEFRATSDLWPTSWIDASNAYERPMNARYKAERAHYADFAPPTETLVQKTDIRPLTASELAKSVNDVEGSWTPNGDIGSVLSTNAAGKYERTACPIYERGAWDVIPANEDFRAKKDGTPWGTNWELWHHPETGLPSWRRPQMRISMTTDASASEILVGSRSAAYVEGRTGDYSTAAHELSHRAEYSVVGVRTLEQAFLYDRSLEPDPDYEGGTRRQALQPIRGTNDKEMCWPDNFIHRYMGRHYDTGTTEILSMGMEAMFAGAHGGLIGIGRSKPDIEYRNMVLGILTTADGQKAAPSASGWNFD